MGSFWHASGTGQTTVPWHKGPGLTKLSRIRRLRFGPFGALEVLGSPSPRAGHKPKSHAVPAPTRIVMLLDADYWHQRRSGDDC